MIKKTVFSMILVSCLSITTLGQSKSSVDTLLQIKDYLLEVKNLADNNTLNGKERYNKASLLLKSAITREAQFKRHLKEILQDNTSFYNELTGKLHWILQSLALYKSDIASCGYKRPNDHLEEQYLTQNIPQLVRQIAHNCQWVKQQIEYRKHRPF